MKNRIILILLLLIFVSINNSCTKKDENPLSTLDEDIEIIGTWTYTHQSIDYMVIINNNNLTDTTNNDYAANISDYNNNMHYVILYWTSHSTHLNKYQRWEWLPNPTTSANITMYEALDTYAAVISNQTLDNPEPSFNMTKQ